MEYNNKEKREIFNTINKVDSEERAAYVKSKYLCDETNLTIPTEDDVVRAKDWVDHGSKL
ncbi:MAG TPA: DUF3787 domain-containing protein [Clostridiales bacterium]|nr:DUF3787 domain-containing protein [Clostridiales bacterium]